MKENVIGKRYWQVVVIEELPMSNSKQRVVKFACDCGRESQTLLLNLVRGNTKSCGCLRAMVTSERMATHGMSKTRIYKIFHGMKNRCFNPRNQAYKYYGARGISICKEWLDDFYSFQEFCLKNGWKPGLQIDRINNDGWYQPDNCRFVTVDVNQKNKRLLYRSNTSGYKGVSKIGPSFKSTVTYQGKSYQKRGFKTAIEAAIYRDEFIRSKGFDTALTFPELARQQDVTA